MLRHSLLGTVLWTALAGGSLLALILGLTILLMPDVTTRPEPLPEEGGSTGKMSVSHPKRYTDSLPPSFPPPALPETPPPSDQGGLAIVIDDLGEDLHAVQTLLNLRLPLIFAVLPHTRFAVQTAEAAHAAGHEVIIHQPMQARNAKMNKEAGMLVVGMPRTDMEAVLRENLRKVPHACGLNNHMGSRFTSERGDVRAFCRLPALSGLFVLDSVTHPASVLYEEAYNTGLSSARRDLFLDARPGREHATAQLHKATRLALSGKRIVVIGHPRQETLAALHKWSVSREPGLRMLRLRDCLRKRADASSAPAGTNTAPEMSPARTDAYSNTLNTLQ